MTPALGGAGAPRTCLPPPSGAVGGSALSPIPRGAAPGPPPRPAALPELSVPLCAISRSPAAPPRRAPRFQEASSRGPPSPSVCGQGQCDLAPGSGGRGGHGWLGQPALLGEKRPALRIPALCTAESRVVDTAARLWSLSILPGLLGPQTPFQTTPLAPTHTQAQGHFLEERRSSSSCFGQVETRKKLSIRGCIFFFIKCFCKTVFSRTSLLPAAALWLWRRWLWLWR